MSAFTPCGVQLLPVYVRSRQLGFACAALLWHTAHIYRVLPALVSYLYLAERFQTHTALCYTHMHCNIRLYTSATSNSIRLLLSLADRPTHSARPPQQQHQPLARVLTRHPAGWLKLARLTSKPTRPERWRCSLSARAA